MISMLTRLFFLVFYAPNGHPGLTGQDVSRNWPFSRGTPPMDAFRGFIEPPPAGASNARQSQNRESVS